MKVLSWNIAHCTSLWHRLEEADADVALLQEACEPPADIASKFAIDVEPWRTGRVGARRPWRTAVVGLRPDLCINHLVPRVLADAGPGELAVSLIGTVAAAHVEAPDTGETYTLISMYAAWERPHAATSSRWIYADASAHRVISDLSAFVGQQRNHRIVAAGDLNSLYGYGEHGDVYWASRHASIFDRLESIGLDFVGPQSPNGHQANPWPDELPQVSLNVPTYRTSQSIPATATRQLDFVFASKPIADRVQTRALNGPADWGESDHCRLFINLPSRATAQKITDCLR